MESNDHFSLTPSPLNMKSENLLWICWSAIGQINVAGTIRTIFAMLNFIYGP